MSGSDIGHNAGKGDEDTDLAEISRLLLMWRVDESEQAQAVEERIRQWMGLGELSDQQVMEEFERQFRPAVNAHVQEIVRRTHRQRQRAAELLLEQPEEEPWKRKNRPSGLKYKNAKPKKKQTTKTKASKPRKRMKPTIPEINLDPEAVWLHFVETGLHSQLTQFSPSDDNTRKDSEGPPPPPPASGSSGSALGVC